MEIKANDMCPKCKHCLGMTPQGMYSCGYNNDGSELNIGVDVVLNCANFEWFEWKDEKVEGRYPWNSDDDKVLKYCANDVTIIAEQMAREKQKELEDKVEKYEKILIDILNETYSHPQLFEHNIHAYELIPGHIRFLKNSWNMMCDKYDPLFEENAKLKETIGELEAENAKLKKEIKRIDAQRDKMMLCSMTDDKRWDDLNNKFWLPLCTNLYGATKVNKTYETILSDISDLKDRADGNYKAAIRKDELIKHLRGMIQDIKQERDRWEERCHNAETDVTTLNSKVEVLDKRNSNQSVMLGEKGKEIERLAKKNRELQIRVNDLLFQEKLNKSAFGYDYEEENGKLRVENEQLRNMLKSQRDYRSYYCSYSALKAKDKIEHIQKEAKKWKDKYKEAYDILETYFKYDFYSMEYDMSYKDDVILKLKYSTPNGDKINKYNALRSAYERLKKL